MGNREVAEVPLERVANLIYLIRKQKVMLDRDLAELYGVETKVLNQAVSRHSKRFPPDFMFRLTKEEWDLLRSQNVTLKPGGRGQHPKYPPRVFTEQGVAMLSTVLNSSRAIDINIQIIRAFVHMRTLLETSEGVCV